MTIADSTAVIPTSKKCHQYIIRSESHANLKLIHVYVLVNLYTNACLKLADHIKYQSQRCAFPHCLFLRAQCCCFKDLPTPC